MWFEEVPGVAFLWKRGGEQLKVASTVVVGDVLRGFVFAGVETVQHVCMYM